MKIGMLGLGTVGTGVVKILSDSQGRSPILSNCQLVQVGVQDIHKKRQLDLSKILTDQLDNIVIDPSINLVIEVIGGLEPARTLILKAIEHGKHIVTANKSLIAIHGSEILEAAQKKNVTVAFEAAVGGGIPIIQCLQKSLGANRITRITGIVNGTTNYILSQMAQNQTSFHDALNDALDKGIAENPPENDTEGIDAANKLAILALVGMGVRVNPEEIFTRGICSISQKDISYAKEMDCTIKLLANVQLNKDNSLELGVQPYLVENMHPLASINNVFNAIFIEGDPIGQLMLYGQGAGSGATASAIVSDLINIADNSGLPNNCHSESSKTISISQETKNNFYLRILTRKEPKSAGAIAWSLGNFNVVPMTIQQQITEEEMLEVVIITESVSRITLESAVNSIRALPYVKEIANIIPVLKV
jgi:homoserine dehydrogenase